MIGNDGTGYLPPSEEGITLDLERKGNPGKLVFNVVDTPELRFEEGDPVTFKVDNKNVFYGFVFTKGRKKDGKIKVTAYDQLRYLKNKDSYILINRTASAIIRMIADDFQLRAGNIADTGWAVPKVDADNKTLFDIILSALDETLQNTGRMYTLYDDFGSLQLRNIEDMKLDYMVDAETAEDYDYTSSIDSNTYNKIKLAFDNKDRGTREFFIAKDSSTMNKWGVLQYFEKIRSTRNGKAKADALLSLYNSVSRKLTISEAFGDIRVRGGSSIITKFDFKDIRLMNYMLVEKVQHNFKNEQHTMKLTLRGGEFVA